MQLKYGYTLGIGSHVNIQLVNGLWFIIYDIAIHLLYLEIIQSNSKVMDWIFIIVIIFYNLFTGEGEKLIWKLTRHLPNQKLSH